MSDLVGTVPQVAERLECSEDLVWALIHMGRLPHARMSPKKVIVLWNELEEWLRREHATSVSITPADTEEQP